MTDTATLRERLVVLEVQQQNLTSDLDETRQVLHKTNNALMALQRSLDAITNQGRGATLVIRVLAGLGGLGWIGGLYAFFQTLSK